MVLCPTDDVIALISGLTDADEPDWVGHNDGCHWIRGETFYAGSYESRSMTWGTWWASPSGGHRFDSEIKIATDITFPEPDGSDIPNRHGPSITANANYLIRYRTSEDRETWTDYQTLSGSFTCHAKLLSGESVMCRGFGGDNL
jgi:hypothetical protein